MRPSPSQTQSYRADTCHME